MAISATALIAAVDGTTTTNYTTASQSPTSGRIVYMAVQSFQVSGNEANASAPSSLSGNGLTWTKVTEDVDTTVGLAFSVWRALASSPSAGAVTINHAGTKANCGWASVEVSGADTSGTNAANSVVQSATAKNTSGTTLTTTLAAFSSSLNGALSFHRWIGGGATPATATPDTGWTELQDTGGTDTPLSLSIESQWRADNDTTAAVTWSLTGAMQSIALEIKSAVSLPPMQRGMARMSSHFR